MKCNIICKFALDNRIMMRLVNKDDIQALDAMIGTCGNAVLVTHIHPDGDAVGSTSAMCRYLSRRGIDAAIIYSDVIPETLRFILDGIPDGGVIHYPEDNEKALERISQADMIFLMDCNSFSRTGALERPCLESSARKVLIDHHLGPDKDSFGLVFSETSVSSASELLFNVLMAMPDVAGNASSIPPAAASALMTGMTTDTNNFANSVYPSTLEMASALLAAGVDRNGILSALYQSGRETRTRMWGYMLYKNLIVTQFGVAYMIMDESLATRFNVQEGETEGLVNEPLKIESVKMSIFLKQDGDGFFRVSVRSKAGYSAVKCSSRYFHGGGHENASGGRLFYKDMPDGTKADIASPELAAEYIEKHIADFFESGEYVSE